MPTGAQAARYYVRPRISPSPSSLNIIILLLVLFSSHHVAVSQESQALLKFKSSLVNADPALSNWGSPSVPSPCSGNHANWAGVICFNGHVFGLVLENMNLKGQIDVDSLVPLPLLRTLSFMNNNFEGIMPDWRKLGALKALFLSNNKFSGQVPDDVFKSMTSLKKIYMANNRFTGPIPTSLESPKLIELRLENNQFTGSIPDISSDQLKVLNVSNNQLEGPVPENLLHLDSVSFSGNKGLCGKPPMESCAPPPNSDPLLISPPAGIGAGNTEDKPNSQSPSRIAIIVISALVGLFLVVLLLLLYRRSHNSQAPRLGKELSKAPSARAKNVLSNASVAASAVAVSARSAGGSGRKGGEQQQGGASKLSFVSDDRQKFDLQDLMRASAEVLGSGNFGASYKAVLVDGEALVVKRFKQMNNVAKEDFHEHMRRLARLKHPNLLPLVAYLYRKEEKLLVFDYVHNGSLYSHLHGKHTSEQPGLSWASRLKIIKGVAKGLAYLNSELPALAIPHGHLKSSNVLIDNDFNPQLMDYTLAPVVNPNQVQEILVAYKAPEYAKNGRPCKKTDVWCLGILILETLTGRLVAKYLYQGCGPYNAELAGWITAIVGESSGEGGAFDKEMMVSSESCRVQMEKLLQIGIACCQEDLDNRLDLEEAVKQIEQVHDE